MEKTLISISVRYLVEFILRNGDIDNRGGGFADREAMHKGSKLHRKIQKQMGATYTAEVSLNHKEAFDFFDLKVEGRADGIFEENDRMVIDEIKGTYADLQYIEEPVAVHLAQAKCYAYFYGSDLKEEEIGVQMTYANLESEDIKRFSFVYQMAELKEWYDELIRAYYKWAKFQYDWGIKRNSSMKELEFPFEYRSGQKQLVHDVYRTILREKELFVNAPTGVGKTMSTVFPAVRAVGEGLGDKIFYLTAKTITRTVAEEAFALLGEKGLSYKSITLTSKEKMCVCDKVSCNPDDCPRAEGHYDRVNDAVFYMIENYNGIKREDLLDTATQYNVCPYEFQLDVANWVDAVICDYNYVFDPVVYLKRFFADGVPKGNHIFLIDEAHNLVDRGREMYSADIEKEDFLEMNKLLKPHVHRKKLLNAIKRSNKKLLQYKNEIIEENEGRLTELNDVGDLVLSLMNVAGELEEFLKEYKTGELRDPVLNFYFSVKHFVDIYDYVDDNYVIYAEMTQKGRFRIKLFCVNPAVNLQRCIDKGRSAVFFSATLLPINYYKRLFSTNEDDYAVYVDSPFDAGMRKLLIGSGVSTKYTRRNQAEFGKMAAFIQEVVSKKNGNYLIFFPSYSLMQEVYDVFMGSFALSLELRTKLQIEMQRTDMNEREREEFLAMFAGENTGDDTGKNAGTLLGFCVMGGIFSEGIDLDGEKLIGAIVIGTGIPQVNGERELLKTFYDRKGENGFDYAYRFPGMNKVLQSAGRVIRTTEDRGVIALLDERFLNRSYLEIFPREWNDYESCSLQNVGTKVETFWKSQESETGQRISETEQQKS